MALFQQPDKADNSQEILAQLVTRLNDVDRRLRIAEQAISNQKLNINNLNENFINSRKEMEHNIGGFGEKLNGIVQKLAEIEKKVLMMAEEMRKLPTTAELAELKTRSIISSGFEKGPSNLNVALDTLEEEGASLEDELK